MKMDVFLSITVAIYFFCLGSKLSNAAYSISLALLFLATVYIYYKKQFLPKFPSSYIIPLVLLLGPLLISNLLLGDFEGLPSVLKYLKYALPGMLTYYIFSYKFYKRELVIGTFGIAAVISAYSMYQFFTMPANTRIAGLGDHPNNLAFLLETLLPFMVFMIIGKFQHESSDNTSKFGIFFAVIVFMATVFALLVSRSRGGMSSIAFGILSVFWAQIVFRKIKGSNIKKGTIYFLTMIILLGSCIGITRSFKRSYDNERNLLIQSTYNMWNDHKLLGVGIDNWKKEYDAKYILPQAKEPDLDMPHCVPLFFFSTTGIIGGIGYLAFTFFVLFYLFRAMIRNPENLYIQAMLASFIAITAHGMVDSGFTNKFIQRPFWSYYGVTLASMIYYSNLLQSRK